MNNQYYNNNEDYISEDIRRDGVDFREFTINELSSWLITKTAPTYSLEALEQHSEAFYIFENIVKGVKLFKKKWKSRRIQQEMIEIKAEGMEEEKEKIAKNLLAQNIDIDIISNVTGLSKQDIESIKSWLL